MLKHLCICLFAAFLMACEPIVEEQGPRAKVVLEVKNSSTVDVELRAYSQNGALYLAKGIAAGDSQMVEEGFMNPAPHGPTYALTQGLDSAVFLFSDGKKLTQCFWERGLKDSINNVLSSQFYRIINEPDRARLQFDLTEQDYLRAQ